MPIITLSANRVNQMPSLLTSTSNTIKEYDSGLKKLKLSLLTIDSNVCSLDDVIGSVKASSQTQEDKINSLEALKQNIGEVIADVVRIDGDAAEAINQSREDFYEKYYYLKPESEKSDWEKIKDGCKKIGEWCKEHWKEIVIGLAFIVIGAVLTVLTGGGTFLAALLVGLKAALISGFISGGINAIGSLITSLFNGNSFDKALSNGLQSFGDGFANGFMWGGIFAGCAQTMAGALRFSRSGTLHFGSRQWSLFSANNFNGKQIGLLKIWSPNGLGNPNSGGTLFKIGRTFRIDFEAGVQLFHTHISYSFYNRLPAFVRTVKWIFDPSRRDIHVRLTSLLGGIVGAAQESKKKKNKENNRD